MESLMLLFFVEQGGNLTPGGAFRVVLKHEQKIIVNCMRAEYSLTLNTNEALGTCVRARANPGPLPGRQGPARAPQRLPCGGRGAKAALVQTAE